MHVTARDRTKIQDVLAAGAHWHETAREVGAAADVVVLMVPDMPEVQELLDGADGLLAGLAADSVVVISSTVSPEAVRRLGAELAERPGGPVHVVDAPVSGGEEGATAGTLSIMVGGADEAVARVQPVLGSFGRPVHLGPLGSGQVAKACNQMIVAATVLALGEASVVAERAGLDVAQMLDLLSGGYAASRIMEVKKRRFAEHDHSPSGAARFMVKDLTFAVDEARGSGTATPQTDVLLDVFTRLTEQGLGDQDTAVVQAFVEGQQRSDG
ncbi:MULTISPECIES: NAD(P)-dependent oxidoreductase [unclassified Modestobacter]